jgi:hypothetical protein
MEKPSSFGLNKTGIDMSPMDSELLLNYAQQCGPDIEGDASTSDNARQRFIEHEAPVGSVPLPTDVKGVLKTVKEKIAGNDMETWIDKLGERLAFERNGVRLYELIKNKAMALAPDNAPLLQDLHHIHDEEMQHFLFVVDCLKATGADATAQTPCADVIGLSCEGIGKVIADPRTTLAQSLDAMLTAELADNVGWELLIELAIQTQQPERT